MTTQTEKSGAPVHELDMEQVGEFAEVIGAHLGIGNAGMLAYIGDRLGLWEALAAAGTVTPDDLAATTGVHPRYIEEWLAAQATVGYLLYDEGTGSFTLPAEHAAVLVDGSPASMVGGFEFQAGAWAGADRIAEAFRTGGGMLWGDHDPRLARGTGRLFKPLYEQGLVPEWLPSLDGVVEKLTAGGRVLDVGCGHGLSTILMAQAFPASRFQGVDLDEGSVVQARKNAEAAGVSDNVRFQTTGSGELDGEWDLISFFDSFHHVGDPVGMARQARNALSEEGALLLVEPLAEDSIEGNLQLAGMMYYGPSAFVCVPDAMAQGNNEALGAQAGPDRLLTILTEAGFEDVEVAAETDMNLVIGARA